MACSQPKEHLRSFPKILTRRRPFLITRHSWIFFNPQKSVYIYIDRKNDEIDIEMQVSKSVFREIKRCLINHHGL